MSIDRPLAGLRVVDLVDGPLAPITRYLAELGARVDRYVPATGHAADIAANAGKNFRAGQIDQDALAEADIIVAPPGAIDYDTLAAANPALVLMEVSPFGTGNSFGDWQASDAVLHALSGSLSRSGIRGRAPLLPPGELAWQCAAAQGAYVVLAACFKALRSGVGDRIDFSALDGAMDGRARRVCRARVREDQHAAAIGGTTSCTRSLLRAAGARRAGSRGTGAWRAHRRTVEL